MASAIITRLKKSKQPIEVTDVSGNAYVGVVSSWDDDFFAIRTAAGDDIFFPIASLATMVIRGGFEKRD